MINIREFRDEDIESVLEIWNEVVLDGIAFPQTDILTKESGLEFFKSQNFVGVAEDDETKEILGMYILHPNNVGRCGHIANSSYAVSSRKRGLGIGEKLVTHSTKMAKECGFRILQFNAVVATNYSAIHLYEKLGFTKIGVIPGGFLKKDGHYEDIVLFYYKLV